MPKILLDGREFTPPIAFDAWGEVLQELDVALAAGGRIVTDVRFDGVDEAAFRDPSAIGRSLRDLVTLEVVSGTPRTLMDRCLDEALAAIPPLCEAAISVGAQYRAANIHAAGGRLAELADGLASLVEIVRAAGSALHVELNTLRCENFAAPELLNALGGHLRGLVCAHEAADWIGVANTLQHDVEPSLRRLISVLELLRGEDSMDADERLSLES